VNVRTVRFARGAARVGCALVLVCSNPAFASSVAARSVGDGLQRAIELVGRGDTVGALRAAEDESDALARDQARVYVLHHAGDLEGALRAAEGAVHAHPNDAWLAERLVYIATSLRRVAPAREGLARLESAAALAPEAERAGWNAKVESSRADILELTRAHERIAASRSRSRVVTWTIGIVGLVLLAFLARPTSPRASR
jgi:hypothetical protein